MNKINPIYSGKLVTSVVLIYINCPQHKPQHQFRLFESPNGGMKMESERRAKRNQKWNFILRKIFHFGYDMIRILNMHNFMKQQYDEIWIPRDETLLASRVYGRERNDKNWRFSRSWAASMIHLHIFSFCVYWCKLKDEICLGGIPFSDEWKQTSE